MALVQISKPKRAGGKRRAQHLVLVNPPGLRGRTNERSERCGAGASRPLRPFEKDLLEIPPLDFLYLAAVAERAKAKVTIVDLLLERHRGAAAGRFCLERIGPVGTAEMWVGVRLSLPSLRGDLAFAERLKALLPSAKVFVFGPAILPTIDRWVTGLAIDYVFYGEPEAFFERVLAARDPLEVPGVVDPKTYLPLDADDLHDDAKVRRRHAGWIRVERLGSLPRPAWHLLDMGRYAPGGTLDTSSVVVSIQPSRGCTAGSKRATQALLEGRVFRSNDVDRVAGEVEYLNETFGIRRIRFRDPSFGIERRYVHTLADALIERAVKLDGTVESSLDAFDEETLLKLRQAGIHELLASVEASGASFMGGFAQQTRVDPKLRARVSLCRQIGLRLECRYRIGAPEETWDTVEKTWRFASELGIESRFTATGPFVGTPEHLRAVREGLTDKGLRSSNWYGGSVHRTYALTSTDVDVARAWASMETAISSGRRRALDGPLSLLLFYPRHAGDYLLRAACRSYVTMRKRFPSPLASVEVASARSGRPRSTRGRIVASAG